MGGDIQFANKKNVNSPFKDFVEHPDYDVQMIANDVALVRLPINSIPAYTGLFVWKIIHKT